MDTTNIILHGIYSTFFEAKLTRPGQGQMLKAKCSRLRPSWRGRGQNFGHKFSL